MKTNNSYLNAVKAFSDFKKRFNIDTYLLYNRKINAYTVLMDNNYVPESKHIQIVDSYYSVK